MPSVPYSFGWLHDLPDFRDYTPDNLDGESLREKDLKELLESLGYYGFHDPLPATVDLRPWCSPIENQGEIGSCTAQAGVSLMEYLERKAFGNHIEGSRLFVYKATRNLLKLNGDTGAYLRTTMGALALFGVPPESFWPYEEDGYDEEPPPFIFSLAQNYKATHYYRLDSEGKSWEEILKSIKTHLYMKLPGIFGFTVYDVIRESVRNGGDIPFPRRTSRILGGHAVMAVGYDDNRVIEYNDARTTGALLIRNSWGEEWGNKGYGWLPYEYFRAGIADDYWCLLKKSYVDTNQFGF